MSLMSGSEHPQDAGLVGSTGPCMYQNRSKEGKLVNWQQGYG